MNNCQAEFAALSKAVHAEAKVFCMTYGKDPNECYEWEIRGDQEHHIDTKFTPPTSSNIVNSSFDLSAPMEKNFFACIYPSVKVMQLLLINIWQSQELHIMKP